MNSGVWERTGPNEISEGLYIRAIAFFTAVAGGLVALGTTISYSWPMSWLLLLGTFVLSIVGIFIFTGSDDPGVSALGVSLMSIMLGLMMGPVVALYHAATVAQAIVITGTVMVTMSGAGIIFPFVFRGWGPYLLAGLVLLLIAQFAQIILFAAGFTQAAHMPIITWVGIGLFTAYVAYDWSRALDLPHTWDNAIDASGALILDAVNLFIRILELLGKK